MLELRESDQGKEQTLRLGQMVKVSLPENPTTGYRWKVETEANCELTGDEFHRSSIAVGSSGLHEWTFKAVAPGHCTITFVRRRPWEGPTKSESTFSIRLRIVESGAA